LVVVLVEPLGELLEALLEQELRGPLGALLGMASEVE